jgi:uncharacterized protein (DUF302 family)
LSFTISRTIEAEFDGAIERTTAALKTEGFGILTDIDIKTTMKSKLGIDDFPRYRILGACNPPIAHAALAAEPSIGVMLPCNVVVREISAGQIEIAAINPVAAIGAIGNPALIGLAEDVAARLTRAVAAI